MSKKLVIIFMNFQTNCLNQIIPYQLQVLNSPSSNFLLRTIFITNKLTFLKIIIALYLRQLMLMVQLKCINLIISLNCKTNTNKTGQIYNLKIIFTQQIKQYFQKTLVILMVILWIQQELEAINHGFWLVLMTRLFIFTIWRKLNWHEVLLEIKVLLLI